MDLTEAKRLIDANLRRLESEAVALEDTLFRVPAASIRALKPQPGYDQSTRDGYVISAISRMQQSTDQGFKIVGEIPAGNTNKRRLQDGTACRIMTGALIPSGGVRVVAQEDCREAEGSVWMAESVLQKPNVFIRCKGCEIKKGRVVVQAGEPILPGHQVLLAATGHAEAHVYRRPRVGFLCTGSELVGSPAEEQEGLKVSGNHYLLNGLIRLSGAVPAYQGTVADTQNDLAAAFGRLKSAAVDIILTTGGVGPGKYDLLEEAFVNAGGKVGYRSLNIRPGKSTLFGLLGTTLFFGLPGPPPAVSVLFNELVRPALLYMQGMKKNCLSEVRATLLRPQMLKERGVPILKAAVVSRRLGRYVVRPAGKIQIPNGYIFFPARKRRYRQGDIVKVRLTDPNLLSY